MEWTAGRNRWRHLALVWNSEEKTATFFIDHYLSGTAACGGSGPSWMTVRSRSGTRISGLIDEVRNWTRPRSRASALSASRDSELRDASFASDQQILPRDSGALDIKEHFGAVEMESPMTRRRFNRHSANLPSRVPLAYHTLLIPAGIYRISRTLHVPASLTSKALVRQDGAGFCRMVVFTDPSSRTGPADEQLGRRNRVRIGVNGSSISIYLDGVTINNRNRQPRGQSTGVSQQQHRSTGECHPEEW